MRWLVAVMGDEGPADFGGGLEPLQRSRGGEAGGDQRDLSCPRHSDPDRHGRKGERGLTNLAEKTTAPHDVFGRMAEVRVE